MPEKKQAKKKEVEGQRVMVSFYPEEHEPVLDAIENGVDGVDSDKRVDSKNLNSRDIRQLFGLRPTHRRVGIKREIADRVKDLTDDEQKEVLDDLRDRTGEEE